MINKKISKYLIVTYISTLNSCQISPAVKTTHYLVSNQIQIDEKVEIKQKINNLFNHKLEYKFSAERGEVVLEKDKYFYYPPFTGGEDIVKFEIFDKTDNKALPT